MSSLTTTCPDAVLAALPEDLRQMVVRNNSHLDTAVNRRDLLRRARLRTSAPEGEVRAGWIALGHLTARALPLGPLAAVSARFVAKTKLHHPDCRLLHSPQTQTAALADIAHRPICGTCDGPGFDLSDEHLHYLCAVMAIDDLTDPMDGPVAAAAQRWNEATTVADWRQRRRDELAACDQVMAATNALATRRTGDRHTGRRRPRADPTTCETRSSHG